MHAIRILDMLLNNRIESPYNQLIQGEVPLLSKTNVKSVLSEKIKNFEIPNHAEKIFGVKEMKIRGQSAGLKENKKLLKESIIFWIRIEQKQKEGDEWNKLQRWDWWIEGLVEEFEWWDKSRIMINISKGMRWFVKIMKRRIGWKVG